MRLGRIRTNAIGSEVGVNGRRYASTSEIAAAERIDRGYLSRSLQLPLLAPDIVETILDGQHAAELGLPKLMRPLPVDWRGQRTAFAEAAHREPPWDALAGAEPERRTARCRRAGTARLA